MASTDIDFGGSGRTNQSIDQAGTDQINAKIYSTHSIFGIDNETNSSNIVDLNYEYKPDVYFHSSSILLKNAHIKFDVTERGDEVNSTYSFNLSGNSSLELSANFVTQIEAPYQVAVHMADGGSSTLIVDPSALGPYESAPQINVYNMTPFDKIHVVGATKLSFNGRDGLFFSNDNGENLGYFQVTGVQGLAREDIHFKDGTMHYACFLKGTNIATPEGEVQVETLKAGDKVRTVSGSVATVKWLGYRTFLMHQIATEDAKRAFPILFKKDCIADNVPHRDLIMSPGHHISFDGNLISAMNLVNGVSIVQLFNMRAFQYFHVELEQFDILLAEGVPAESYVDTGNRKMFQNAAEVAMNPDFGPATGRPDVPGITIIRKGPVLEEIRAKLLERAENMIPAEGEKKVA